MSNGSVPTGGNSPKNKCWTLLGRSHGRRTSGGKAASTSPINASSTTLKSLAILRPISSISTDGFRALDSFGRESKLPILPIDDHFVAIVNLARQKSTTDGSFQFLLDCPLQRTSAINRVIALARQVGCRLGRQLNVNVSFGETRSHP